MHQFLFLILSSAPFISGQPCEDNNSVDLYGGELFHDGSIIKDGVVFPPKYVYTKNVSGEIKTLGCLCKIKKCFRKCCEMGSVMFHKKCSNMSDKDIILNDGLDLYFINAFQKRVKLDQTNELSLVYGRPCPKVYLEDDGHWFVQTDGNLYVYLKNNIPPWVIQTPDKYCIDTFIYEDADGNTQTKLDALACFVDEAEPKYFVFRSICMLMSCVFILVTVAVYAWLPELRNIHGRVLMAYLLCLFTTFLLMATMQILLTIDNITVDICVGLTIVIYFALESAFFWLNVMSFDIWWTFSGKGGIVLKNMSKRFCAYSMYAFGVPTLLTAILVGLEFSGLPPQPFLPMLRDQGCFLYGRSRLLYLYGPMLILCIANMVFFILTVLKIAHIKQQTAMLKSNESATHDQHRREKRRLLLYVKLFTVMGINWLLEVISALYPDADYIWIVTDTYNDLIGVTIFVIFVCKRKIFHLMKKRYKQLRGDPMSRTQTTSTRTMSSKDDVRMSTNKNY